MRLYCGNIVYIRAHLDVSDIYVEDSDAKIHDDHGGGEYVDSKHELMDTGLQEQLCIHERV